MAAYTGILNVEILLHSVFQSNKGALLKGKLAYIFGGLNIKLWLFYEKVIKYFK